MLSLELIDDGAGIDLERLRSSIVERALSPADTVARMSEEVKGSGANKDTPRG